MFRFLRPFGSRMAYRRPVGVRFASYTRFNNKQQTVSLPNLLRSRNTLYAVGGFFAFYLYNLDLAPFTGRLRLIWIPLWLERKIGDYSYNQIYLQYRNQIVPSTDPLYDKIRGIMNRLLSAALANTTDEKQRAHLKSLDWSIHIIQDNSLPNAFILPNGKIFIFSSILPICHDEQGLATVLSHELSHQLAHHTLEQLSLQPFYILLSTLMYSITGISGFNDLLILGLLQLPSSREQESEADRIGCELMARLCYNLQLAVQFWRRMQQVEEREARRDGLLLKFFLTHPATDKRVHDIETWIPELQNISESSGCHEYGRFSEGLRNYFKR